MKINEVEQLVNVFALTEKSEQDPDQIKGLAQLTVRAFNLALGEEEARERYEKVKTIVAVMKKLARYDESIGRFLIAKKKMLHYSILEQLSDPNMVSFTLHDCEMLKDLMQRQQW